MVEHVPEEHGVPGSSPGLGTRKQSLPVSREGLVLFNLS